MAEVASYPLFLESVRRLHAGLQSFLSMRRIEARRKNASAFRLRFSQSLASLPPVLPGGISGSTSPHSASVRSLGRNLLRARFLFVHIGDPSSNQATTLESQMIHMIQELFGQTVRGKRWSVAMDREFRRGFTTAEKTELWDRWQRGESLKAIGRLGSRHRRFISRCRHTVGFVQLLGVARGWR